MAGSNLHPVTLVLRGTDRITGVVNKISNRLNALQRPVRDLRRSFENLNKQMGFTKVLDRATAVGTRLRALAFQAISLGGAFAFLAVRGVKKFVDEADSLDEAATAAGVTTDQLQELRYAASFAGVSTGTLDGLMRRFSTSLGQAKLGTGALNKTLGKNAPALLKSMKAATSTGEAFDLFMDAAERAKDPTLRNALLGAGFGRGGSILAPMIEGLKDMRHEAHTTDNVLSVETVAAAKATADEFDRAGKRARGLSNIFFAELLPTVLNLVRQFNSWTQSSRDLVKVRVVEFAQNVATIVRSIAENLPGVIEKVQSIVEWIGGWRNVLIALTAIKLAPFTASVISLSAALATNPVGWFIIALAAIAVTITLIITHWDELMARFDSVPVWVRKLLTGEFAGLIPGVGPAISAGTDLLDLSRAWAGHDQQAAPNGHIRIEASGLPFKLKEMSATGVDLSFLTGPIMSGN